MDAVYFTVAAIAAVTAAAAAAEAGDAGDANDNQEGGGRTSCVGRGGKGRIDDGAFLL